MQAFGNISSIKGSNAFRFVQSTPSTTWTINHNFGQRPSVYVIDTAGDECEGDVDHTSVNQTVITFSAPFAGEARLT